MGMLALARLMSRKRRRRAQSDESTASEAGGKGSPCRHGGNSGVSKPKRRRKSHLTLDRLPQDVLPQILALLPMQDAARTACVCRELLQSWRYYPELEFSAKTLALHEQHTCLQGKMATDIIRRIDDALQNRAGSWVKRLKFELQFFRKLRARCINHWLNAATHGVEELTLELPRDDNIKYRFPCKRFFDTKGCSIQSLRLYACAFHPESCSFRSLKRVQFSWVHITTEESCLFLSSSHALEHLELGYCHEIACLRIPCTLQLLNFLRVERCNMLQMIESDAPNLSTFHYEGPIIQLSLGDSLHLKDVHISIYPWFNLFDYARKELPTVALNLETLFLMSANEVEQSAAQKSHLVIDPSKLIELPRHCHQNIKHVTITGFCPIKELMELIFYILDNAVSLQCLTLDNRVRGFEKVLVERIAQDTGTRDYQDWKNNFHDNEGILRYTRRADPNPYWEAYLSHIAIRKYILGRVPSHVELKILGAPPDEIISSLSESERQWHTRNSLAAGW